MKTDDEVLLFLAKTPALHALQKPVKGMTIDEKSQLLTEAAAVAARLSADGTETVLTSLMAYAALPGFQIGKGDMQKLIIVYYSQMAGSAALRMSKMFDRPIANVMGEMQQHLAELTIHIMENENASKT